MIGDLEVEMLPTAWVTQQIASEICYSIAAEEFMNCMLTLQAFKTFCFILMLEVFVMMMIMIEVFELTHNIYDL